MEEAITSTANEQYYFKHPKQVIITNNELGYNHHGTVVSKIIKNRHAYFLEFKKCSKYKRYEITIDPINLLGRICYPLNTTGHRADTCNFNNLKITDQRISFSWYEGGREWLISSFSNEK